MSLTFSVPVSRRASTHVEPDEVLLVCAACGKGPGQDQARRLADGDS
jgi:hypothetical protein